MVEFKKYNRLDAFLDFSDILPYCDRNFQIFEKIDGGNCQVSKEGDWTLRPGSRAGVISGPRAKKLWFPKLLKWVYSNGSLYNLPEQFVMFGEWSGNHTIEYDPENTDQFFLIDLFDKSSRRFLPYDEAKNKVRSFGIEGVRFLDVLHEGNLTPWIVKRNLVEERSNYYPGHKEGLVLKDYDSDQQVFFKVHHPDFAEKRRLRSGQIDYLLPARYRKNIFRLAEDSSSNSVSMDNLVRLVINDVRSEGGPIYDELTVKYRLLSLSDEGHFDSVRKRLPGFEIV